MDLYGRDPWETGPDDDTGPDYNDAIPGDDPVCVCGTHRSEHALCGCPEGFQTAAGWTVERAFIESLSDWEYERIYGES